MFIFSATDGTEIIELFRTTSQTVDHFINAALDLKNKLLNFMQKVPISVLKNLKISNGKRTMHTSLNDLM